MSWKLQRTKQCAKCPWKVSTDPRDIPHGYSEDLHRSLAGTIADGTGNLAAALGKEPLRIMACHEHPVGKEVHCLGWLMNQLGDGNNIALRLAMLDCENLDRVDLDGPQHDCFEDTLPKDPETPGIQVDHTDLIDELEDAIRKAEQSEVVPTSYKVSRF